MKIYLYHGIVEDLLNEILKDGINPGSYYGNEGEASRYATGGKMFKIDPDDYEVLPNQAMIDYHEENEEEYDEDDEYKGPYQEWLNSSQTWQDSLNIFGSVGIECRVMVSKKDIIII